MAINKSKMMATRTRQLQNAGVASGTVRKGAKGKSVRKYNSSTGKWEKMARPSMPQTRSTAPKKVSGAGTYTKSYERSSGGKMTVPAFFATVDQGRREQRRIAAAKRRKG